MQGSVQEKLARVRPPRVQITYDVEIGDAIEKKELPFIIGVMADLSGNPKDPLPPMRERKFVEIDRDNFDDVLAAISPRITPHEIENQLPGGEGNLNVELIFTKIDDFYPTEVVKRVEPLNKLYESRSRLRDMLGKLDGNDALDALLRDVLKTKDKQDKLKGLFKADDTEGWKSVTADDTVAAMLDEGEMAHEEQQKEYAMQLLGEFTNSVLSEEITAENPDAAALINDRIAVIDGQITGQLNAIMHHPDFQALEASWRGLHYLVMNSETSTHLKIRLLNASKMDLSNDLGKAVEFDQSALFKKVYEDEYGTYGGHPYSVLIGDYEFGRHPTDTKLLEGISGVAAAAHAPFIASAYAKLFDLSDFAKLHKPRDLSKIFESAELITWRSFRSQEDSRYVCLTLPRILLRLPYGTETDPVENIAFEENVDGRDAKKYLWGNSSYALAQRIANAFSLYGWTAAIRGVEGGGLIEGLPAHVFKTDDGDLALTCPTEVAITDRREKELTDLGFMAICHCKGTDKAAFFGGQTTNQPKKFNLDEANANANISAMLPYIMAASRFAHYIKVIMREKVGSFLTRGNVEDYLNTWIGQYVLLDDSPPQEVKARYPLRQARVVVSDVPGKPGSYRATVFLKPHFQLEELTTSIRLVAELPA